MTLIKIQKHVYQLLVLVALTIVESYYSVDANTTDTYDHLFAQIQKENLMIFHDLDSVLKVFNSGEHSELEETRKVIHDFNHVCLGYGRNPLIVGTTKQPFIVIEGNHRTSRKIVSRRLARRIGGSFLQNPPNCLIEHRANFAYGSVLRRAYFGLSVYAAAQVATRIMNRFPVVLNGYWMDQTAFTISRAFAEFDLPPQNSTIYKWPYDLLKPDLTFYIDFPDNLHSEPITTRIPLTWKKKLRTVYNNMKDDKLYEISTAQGFDKVVNEIERIITERLSDKYEITFTDRPPRRRYTYI